MGILDSVHLMERALELARSGKYRTVEDIHRTLVKERYESVGAYLASPSFRNQLKAVMREAGVKSA